MRDILNEFKEGKISLNECERRLKANNILEFDEMVNFDKSREIRTGFPEAVYCESKTYDDIVTIVNSYFKDSFEDDLILTRLSNDRYEKLLRDFGYLVDKGFIFDYSPRGEILVIKTNKPKETIGKIGIVTAGTSDANIAEEARVIVEQGGCEAITSYDIGVAGIHRLFPKIAHMVEQNVDAIIVCAGMEGALPTVVAGLVDVPVIAVPTSVGYGVGEGGIAALHSMLQSCAPGIAVVNIDNGFGAAVFALTISKNKHDF